MVLERGAERPGQAPYRAGGVNVAFARPGIARWMAMRHEQIAYVAGRDEPGEKRGGHRHRRQPAGEPQRKRKPAVAPEQPEPALLMQEAAGRGGSRRNEVRDTAVHCAMVARGGRFAERRRLCCGAGVRSNGPKWSNSWEDLSGAGGSAIMVELTFETFEKSSACRCPMNRTSDSRDQSMRTLERPVPLPFGSSDVENRWPVSRLRST